MYTYLMLPGAVRAEVPALAAERRERRERRQRRSDYTSVVRVLPHGGMR
jgi:hypothetical protein